MGRQRAKLARAMTDIETSRMICHCVLYPVLTYIEKKREGGGNFSAAIFRPSIRHAGKIKPHREKNTVTKGAAHSENGGTGSRRSGPGDPRRFGAKARPLRKGRGRRGQPDSGAGCGRVLRGLRGPVWEKKTCLGPGPRRGMTQSRCETQTGAGEAPCKICIVSFPVGKRYDFGFADSRAFCFLRGEGAPYPAYACMSRYGQTDERIAHPRLWRAVPVDKSDPDNPFFS